MTGRTTEAMAISKQAFDDHLALGDELAIASPGTHRVNLLFALIQAGRLDEAEERGRSWFDAAARARMPLGVIWTGSTWPVARWPRATRRRRSSGASGRVRPSTRRVRGAATGCLRRPGRRPRHPR